ncbi:MAG: dipeptidyl aminopeptidase [Gammaproteobacteria bacterium]|nr:MAG: dipeptidyl aminopeptidase [Gammaproteobacteria bacterium]UTW41435.1 dipeptidyl aminopeptidase [bacterium SCSIO 12844]
MIEFVKGKLFNAQFVRVLGQINYQAAELSDCFSITEKLNSANFNTWYDAWFTLAEDTHKLAVFYDDRNERNSAYGAYLRASTYYRAAYFFLEDNPSDKRIDSLLESSITAFNKALKFSNLNYEIINIPYKNINLPAYLYLQPDLNTQRPIIINCAGGDGTKEEAFTTAYEAYIRGYHCLTFEGPGQGSVLRLQGTPFTPNWDEVIKTVIDQLSNYASIDMNNIIYYGKSFGGYLAAKAATKEKRLKAIVLDPAQYGMLDNVENSFLKGKAGNIPLYKAIEDTLSQTSDKDLKFMFNSRLWRYGVDGYKDFCSILKDYDVYDEIKNITSSTMVFDNEEEYLSKGQAIKFYDQLTVEKEYYQFKQQEATGGHCQPLAPKIFYAKMFEWIKKVI